MLPNTTIRFNQSQNIQTVAYNPAPRSIQPLLSHQTMPLIRSDVPFPQNLQINQQYPHSLNSPQLKSEISFGNNYHTMPPEYKISLSQNQQEWNSSHPQSTRVPQPQSQPMKRPQLIENPQKLLEGTRSSGHLKSEVRTFNVDTTDVQTLKQNQFTGCFNCFYPVTYPTNNRGLC